jgi:hypothetical protein
VRAPFTRVPNNHLAQVLNHGLDSIPAVRLLVEKNRHGPGYVLNQRNCAKKRAEGGMEMGKRAFTRGIRVMKSGPLTRDQGGRRVGGRGAFARERMAPGSPGYVAIDEAMLKQESHKVVAFVAAILLSPIARPAADFGERIGLRGKASIGKLVERALAGNFISGVKQGSIWIVARPGADLPPSGTTKFQCDNGPIENGAIENDVAESDATHSNLREPHRKKKKARTPTESGTQVSESLDFCEAELAELRTADLTGALARHLLTRGGLRGYFTLLHKYGDFARTSILRKLGELSMALDGTDPGKIISWNYFEGAIDDELCLLRKSGRPSQ